jgi:hypothetical protein
LASSAIIRRSGAFDAKRAAASVERTMSDSRGDSEFVTASAKLNARKSISGSGFSSRNGSTMRRVTGLAAGDPSLPGNARRPEIPAIAAAWHIALQTILRARGE